MILQVGFFEGGDLQSHFQSHALVQLNVRGSRELTSSKNEANRCCCVELKKPHVHDVHLGVSINGGTPKCGVYKGTSQSKMDDNWGYPYDSGNLH